MHLLNWRTKQEKQEGLFFLHFGYNGVRQISLEPSHLTAPKLSSVFSILFLLLSFVFLTEAGPHSEDTYGLSIWVKHAGFKIHKGA